MGKSLDLKFRYTEKEYCKAFKWFYSNEINIKVDLIISVILILIGCFFWISESESIFNKMFLFLGLIFLFIILFALFLNPKRAFRQEPKYRDEYYLSFTEEGILFQTEHINSTINWKNYLKLKENKDFFYLIYGKYMFTIIPKRSFINSEEQDLFRELVKEKLGQK